MTNPTESFTKKKLDLTITLGTGTFGADVGSTVTLTDLRMFADITSPCGESMGALSLRVLGLSQSMMNQLTVIGPINQVKEKNKILLAAGDDHGTATVFNGTIFSAWADYSAAPDVTLNIIAYAGLEVAVKPVEASSYPVTADAADILEKIAYDAGLDFVNDNVSVQLTNPYYPGTARRQILACVRDSQINHKIENNTLTIWNKGTAISNADVVLIAPETGMVGYPALSSQGMTLKSLFIPKLILGGAIQVKSSMMPKANGEFIVSKYNHNLSSEAPGGPWFTTVDCYPINI
jgi:hypothetical protein